MKITMVKLIKQLKKRKKRQSNLSFLLGFIRLAFIRVKFTNSALKKIREKKELNSYCYGFLSKSGFACDIKDNRIVVSLDELYKIEGFRLLSLIFFSISLNDIGVIIK